MPPHTNTPVNRYGALAAEIYDLDKGVGSLHDPAFYLERLASIDGPMLEPACGSGRAFIPILEAGHDVAGFDASVSFTLPAAELQKQPNQQLEILRAEEGRYVDGVWQTSRILNGDQTDRGLNFRGPSAALVHIRLHKLPLYDEAVHRNVE